MVRRILLLLAFCGRIYAFKRRSVERFVPAARCKTHCGAYTQHNRRPYITCTMIAPIPLIHEGAAEDAITALTAKKQGCEDLMPYSPFVMFIRCYISARV